MSKIKAKVNKLDDSTYEIVCDEFQECYIEQGIVCVGDEECGFVYYADYFKNGDHVESNDFDEKWGLYEYLEEEMNLHDDVITQIIFN